MKFKVGDWIRHPSGDHDLVARIKGTSNFFTGAAYEVEWPLNGDIAQYRIYANIADETWEKVDMSLWEVLHD